VLARETAALTVVSQHAGKSSQHPGSQHPLAVGAGVPDEVAGSIEPAELQAAARRTIGVQSLSMVVPVWVIG
jgi:hypothetical protein